MGAYHNLSEKLQQRIIEDRKEHRANPYAFSEEQVLRREMNHDRANLWRPPFVRDIEKIMHLPIITVMETRRRYFPFTEMMTFQDGRSMCSSFQGLQGILEMY